MGVKWGPLRIEITDGDLTGFEVHMFLVLEKTKTAFIETLIYLDASEYHWRSNSGCTF